MLGKMRLSKRTRAWVSTLGLVVVPLVVEVSGVQGFWAVFAVCMGAVAWSLFFFRDEISRIRILPDESIGPNAERPLWLILPGTAMLLLALYPFVHLYMAAAGFIKPLTPDDLLESYISNRSLYVTDLARTDSVVRDKTFENVTFVGPAVVTLAGYSNMVGCAVEFSGADEKEIFLEVPHGTVATAVIIFDNCIFRNCRFRRVQFIGTKELFDKLKAGSITTEKNKQ